MNDIQRINVRIPLDAPLDADVTPILAIFARWRQDSSAPEDWLDMADYAHVPEGPFAMIVGTVGNFVFDAEGGRPSLLYRNKTGLTGSLEERVTQAIGRGLDLIGRLTTEDEYPTAWSIATDSLEVAFNDRVNLPNTEPTHAAVSDAVHAALQGVLGGAVSVAREDDSGRLYALRAAAPNRASVSELLARAGDPSADASAPVEPTYRRVAPQEAAALVDRHGYVYIDVRTVREFEAGHPKGAYNIPIADFDPARGMQPNTEFTEIVSASFGKHDKILVGCKAGGRSHQAAQVLLGAGFTDLVDNYAGFDGGRGPNGLPEAGWGHVGLPTSTQAEAGRDYAALAAKSG